MPSRRTFLQAGLAASVIPPVLARNRSSSVAARPGDSPTARRSIYKIVSDVRFAASQGFLLEAERLNVSTCRMAGDITDFWFNDLSSRWREGRAVIAGLTAHGPLFCLERWAWDHRMRVVFRGEHVWRDGRVHHTLSGPAPVIARAHVLAVRQEWSRGVAHLVTTCGTTGGGREAVTISVRTPAQPDERHEPLFSWVIA